jgi:hypothetical protein
MLLLAAQVLEIIEDIILACSSLKRRPGISWDAHSQCRCDFVCWAGASMPTGVFTFLPKLSGGRSMVNIQIEAPEYPMEIHRRLSERIIRVVAETYRCEEAEILLSIVVKPPALAADSLVAGGSDLHTQVMKVAG